MRFKNELERNITIKLGYANAKVGSHLQGVFRKHVLNLLGRSTSARTPNAADPVHSGRIRQRRSQNRSARSQDAVTR